MRSIVRRTRALLALPALLAFAGCYHYVPATTTAQPQGTPIRAHLNTLSAFELAQVTVNNVETVEGEVIRAEAGQLFLSATWLEAAMGGGYPGNGWTVEIPEANVSAFELKRFSWWRTGVIIGGLAAGTWIGFDALGLTGSRGDGGGGTGPIL